MCSAQILCDLPESIKHVCVNCSVVYNKRTIDDVSVPFHYAVDDGKYQQRLWSYVVNKRLVSGHDTIKLWKENVEMIHGV